MRGKDIDQVVVAENDKGAMSFAGIDESKIPDSFTKSLYFGFTKAFASNNPKQMFCLSWPGTVLDYERMAWDKEEEIAGNMPERALIRASQVLDVYVPPSPITQPDGTRVSDRYELAIDSLGPIPNAGLIEIQNVIRDRLRMEVVKTVDGKEQTFTLVNWFNYLYTQWSNEKQQWGDKQTQTQAALREEFKGDDKKYWDAYLKWYEENADSYIQEINSKWDQLLIEFPLTEWEDAISILDTKDDGGLSTAKELMNNVRLPLPRQEGGIDYAPSAAIPYDWPLELKPTTKHMDLLSDPLAQKMALDTAIQKLEDEVFNWMAILPQVDDKAFADSTHTFESAVTAYSSAQSALLKTYKDNTVTAVRLFCDIMKARSNPLSSLEGPPAEKAEKGVQSLIAALNQSNAAGAGDPVNWDQIKQIAQAIGEGQDTLIDKQQDLINKGYDLAKAANDYLEKQANRTLNTWLPAYVESLKTKLTGLREQQQQMATTSNLYYKYLLAAGDDADKNPTELANFAKNAFPATVDDPLGDRWTEITIDIEVSEMESNSSMNTYFQQHQWGVDFFLGSAGSSNQYSYSNFAKSIAKKGSKIQIGMLATKVLIHRPWMRPDIFSNTKSFFRTLQKPIAPKEQITQDILVDNANRSKVEDLVHHYAFPSYPVAFLLVKDVTIKCQIDESKTEQVRTMAKSVKSQGGGFLCFSISDVQTSQSQNEKMNSFCMAGQMVMKAPAPQIIGYWVQLLPPDESTELNADIAKQISQAIGFVNKLQEIHASTKEHKEVLTR